MARKNLQIAESETKQTPEQQAADFVRSFEVKLEDSDRAISQARESMNEWWQQQYNENIKGHSKAVGGIAKHMISILERIPYGSSEDTEKDLADSVKAIKTLRTSHEIWNNRVVVPIEQLVSGHNKLIEECINAATEREKREPLLHQGLGDAVKKHMSIWFQYRFDRDDGVIVKL